MTGITFLRSTTRITSEREADGDQTTSVHHLARFAVRDGAVPDLNADHGKATFEPNWLEVTWDDGALVRVFVSGPQRLKDGTTSDKVTRHHNWGKWGRDFAVADLPEAISAAIADYQLNVAVATGAKKAQR